MKTFKKIIITILCVILATALVWGVLFLTVPKVKDKTYELFNIQQDKDKRDEQQDEITEAETTLYTLTLKVSDASISEIGVTCEVKLYIQDKEIESGVKLPTGEKVKGEITLLPTDAQKDKDLVVLVVLNTTDETNSTILTTTKVDNLNHTFEFEMLSEDVEINVSGHVDTKIIIFN